MDCVATLTASGLTYRIGSSFIVNGLDLALAPGSVTGLIGPNGAGKTTAIDLLAGFLRPCAGTITLDGREVTNWHPYSRVRFGLARTLQESPAIPGLSVREHLQLALECGTRHRGGPRPSCESWLKRFALSDLVAEPGFSEIQGLHQALQVAYPPAE